MFNELQHDGLGAATFRQALITSEGSLKVKGQAAEAKLLHFNRSPNNQQKIWKKKKNNHFIC